MAKSLAEEYLPTAPQHGLYVGERIPSSILRNALRDYASGYDAKEVLALFDATLMKSGKDGIVFLKDRFVYQNTDFDSPREVRYDDVIQIERKRKFLGGYRLLLEVNAGSATVTHELDFSGKGGASEYVKRFLYEASLQSLDVGSPREDLDKERARSVQIALEKLLDQGLLSEKELSAMFEAFRTGG